MTLITIEITTMDSRFTVKQKIKNKHLNTIVFLILICLPRQMTSKMNERQTLDFTAKAKRRTRAGCTEMTKTGE